MINLPDDDDFLFEDQGDALDAFEQVCREAAQIATPQEARAAGRDCEVNGASEANCNARFFRTDELRRAWERGRYAAETGPIPGEDAAARDLGGDEFHMRGHPLD